MFCKWKLEGFSRAKAVRRNGAHMKDRSASAITKHRLVESDREKKNHDEGFRQIPAQTDINDLVLAMYATLRMCFSLIDTVTSCSHNMTTS